MSMGGTAGSPFVRIAHGEREVLVLQSCGIGGKLVYLNNARSALSSLRFGVGVSDSP